MRYPRFNIWPNYALVAFTVAAVFLVTCSLPAQETAPPPSSSAPVAGAPVAKLNSDQLGQLNRLAEVASLKKKLADTEEAVSRLQQQLIIQRACWDAGIKPTACDPQADGSLTRPAPPPAPGPGAASIPADAGKK